MTKIPKQLRAALDESGRQWFLKEGRKHRLLYVDGHMVAVVPHGSGRAGQWRTLRNMVATIKRLNREERT